MIRVLIDTNIVISGYLWGGKPAAVLTACRDHILLPVGSHELMKEIVQTFNKPKFVPVFQKLNLSPTWCIQDYERLLEMVNPATDIPDNVVRDPKDRMVIATAVGGHAHYLVSGDDDLLVLQSYRGVTIITPSNVLEIIP